jgi:hypothetical protein
VGQVTDALSLVINAIGGLLNSASKIVFIMLTATICYGFLASRIDTKDFMPIVMIVYTYYFTTRSQAVTGGKE